MKSNGVKAFTLTGVSNPLETQYLLDTMGNKKSPVRVLQHAHRKTTKTP